MALSPDDIIFDSSSVYHGFRNPDYPSQMDLAKGRRANMYSSIEIKFTLRDPLSDKNKTSDRFWTE